MQTSFRVEYRMDVTEGWRFADELDTLPDAKGHAKNLGERGYMIRIQKITVEEEVIWTNADSFPAALGAAFSAQPDRVLGAGTESPKDPAEVIEK